MNRNLIPEGHHSTIAVAKFRDYRPRAPRVVLLALDPYGILHDGDAPLAPQVGALAPQFAFEIRGEAILGHAENLLRPDRERRSLANA